LADLPAIRGESEYTMYNNNSYGSSDDINENVKRLLEEIKKLNQNITKLVELQVDTNRKLDHIRLNQNH